jgi:hypothetical protein
MRTIITLLIIFFATRANAQDPMAKWKPNVGDKFTYYHQQSWSDGAEGNRNTGHGSDTVVMEVVRTDTVIMEVNQTDTSVDTVYRSAVPVEGAPKRYFYFAAGRDTMSSHSFGIMSIPFNPDQGDFRFDFSRSADSEIVVGSNHLTAYRDAETRPYMWLASLSQKALYSPELRWFLYLDNSTYGNVYAHYWVDDYSSYTLIAASTLGVATSTTDNGFAHWSRGTLLHLILAESIVDQKSMSLLDPLGRPVRSWQLAASDGPREISLNVADVPSGVYFLRLQGVVWMK